MGENVFPQGNTLHERGRWLSQVNPPLRESARGFAGESVTRTLLWRDCATCFIFPSKDDTVVQRESSCKKKKKKATGPKWLPD